jgi:type I restriction enzyme S subunit
MSSPVRRELTGRAHGTSSSHQRVSPSDIFNVPFPVSNDWKLEEAFSQASHSLLTKAGENRAQIQNLTKLRDTILPKLMKGEVRVGRS